MNIKLEKQVNPELLKFIKNILKKDDENVIFERSPLKVKSSGFLLDMLFVLVFIILPYILSLLSSWLPSVNSNTLYIINFAILAIVYPLGYIVYRQVNKVILNRNGGIGFFIGLALVQMLNPLILVLLSVGRLEDEARLIASVLITDTLRVLTIVLIFKIARPLRYDVKHVLLNKLPTLAIWVVIIIILNLSINPIFNIINNLINPPSAQQASNQVAIESRLSSKNFTTYWTILTVVIIAPIFEELVYRQGIMVLMRTELMKIIVPTIFFAGIHVTSFSSQDFSHIFLYLSASMILTLVQYIKRNVTYSIGGHQMLNMVSLLASS